MTSSEKIALLIKQSFRMFVIILGLLNLIFGQNVLIPENIQAALMEKALKFNTRLADKTDISMLIIHDENSRVSAERQSRTSNSAWSVTLSMDILSVGDLEAYDLVYFMPGTEKQARECKKHKVLSDTGISAYVEQGLISMAFGLRNDKPRIFVNISSLKAEGHSFSSEILRIMQVTK